MPTFTTNLNAPISLLASTFLTFAVLSACSSSSSTPAAITGDQNMETNTDQNNTDDNNNTGEQTTNTNGIPSIVTLDINPADTGTNPLMYTLDNNSARITGPVIGTGEQDNSAVFEQLDMFGLSGSDALRVVGVWAGQGKFSSVNSTMFLAMHNNSDTIQCGVLIDANMVLKDNTYYGASATDQPHAYRIDVDGSHYKNIDINGYPEFDWDCVPPNSIAFGNVDINEPASFDEGIEYGNVAGIAGASSFVRPYPTDREPAPEIVPVSYTVDDAGEVSVLVENRDGIQAYEVSITAYALSAEGLPMFFFFAPGETVLQAGENGTLAFDGNRFPGTATALRVIVRAEYCGLDAGYAPDC